MLKSAVSPDSSLYQLISPKDVASYGDFRQHCSWPLSGSWVVTEKNSLSNVQVARNSNYPDY